MQKTILLCAVCLSFVISVCDKNPAGPGQSSITDDEIYSAVLSHVYRRANGNSVQLANVTRGHIDYDDPYVILHRETPELFKDTLDDYMEKNTEPVCIDEVTCTANVNIVVYDPEHPQVIGGMYIGFSRVGYSKYGQQALVTMSQMYSRGGVHNMYLLNRVKNHWVVYKSKTICIIG